MIRWPAVAVRTCTITFTGPSGIRHSVEVTAESIYEAAALGVAALRKSAWVESIATGTELEIQVRDPATSHRLTVGQIQRWCEGGRGQPRRNAEEAQIETTVGVTATRWSRRGREVIWSLGMVMCSPSVLPLSQLEVLVIDCQATAAAPRDHLLEIGWAYARTTITHPRVRLIALSDGEHIPPAVARITGISEPMTRDGVNARLAWRELADDAARLTPQPAPTVIHFARFEQPVPSHAGRS